MSQNKAINDTFYFLSPEGRKEFHRWYTEALESLGLHKADCHTKLGQHCMSLPKPILPKLCIEEKNGEVATIYSGYLPEFPEWFEKDLEELVRRLRDEAKACFVSQQVGSV